MRRCRVRGANHDFYHRLPELLGNGAVIVENLTNLAAIGREVCELTVTPSRCNVQMLPRGTFTDTIEVLGSGCVWRHSYIDSGKIR
jgi:hypothetical protein